MRRLTTLPIEVIDHIARTLGGDMRQLRLVCREVENIIFTAFKQTFFSDRLIYLTTEKDLRLLIDILDHAKLRCALQRLEICTDEINDYPHDKPTSPAAKKAQLIKDKKRDLHLLITAFDKMRKHGINLAELVMSERGGEGKGPVRLNTCHAYNVVFEAIDLSGYRLEHFSLTTPYFWSLPAHRISHKSPLPSTLKTLRLNAYLEGNTLSAADVTIKLASLPHLVDLTFEEEAVTSGFPAVDGLATAILKQNFPILKRLRDQRVARILCQGIRSSDQFLGSGEGHEKLERLVMDGQRRRESVTGGTAVQFCVGEKFLRNLGNGEFQLSRGRWRGTRSVGGERWSCAGAEI